MRYLLYSGFWLAALFACLQSSQAQSNPVKMAAMARFDLQGSGAVQALTQGRWLDGQGTIGRATWLSASESERSYSVHAPILHYTWSTAAFRFVPTGSGNVTLTLRGPWEQSPSGPIYQQEVLWDALQVEGAGNLVNGSFEEGAGSTLPGWTTTGGTAQISAGPPVAAQGSRHVRVWHDRNLSCTLRVTNGVPVTLHLAARAFVPPGFEEMPRLTNTQSSAHLALRQFMRGVNLGNYLEAPPNTWGNLRYGTADLAQIRSEGFDHVRIPIAWHHYAGPAPDYALNNSIFSQVDPLVANAIAAGLSVIIDLHHFDDLNGNPNGNTNKFFAIWRQIATHYSSHSNALAFELLNEANGAATTAFLNPLYAEAIRQIRLSNPRRTIFLGPGLWNSLDEVAALRLPGEEENLIVTLHSYEPGYFTHQGADWAGPDPSTRGVVYPGPPPTPLQPTPPATNTWVLEWFKAYNSNPTASNPSSPLAFRDRLRRVKQWSNYYGRPVHIGEFGAYEVADVASRARYYADMRLAMDELGLAWAIWDWKAGFKYWNATLGRPEPGFRESIFPAPKLLQPAPGRLESEAAVGKVFEVQRTGALPPVGAWQTISTQFLDSPRLQFQDTGTNAAQGHYRVKWRK